MNTTRIATTMAAALLLFLMTGFATAAPSDPPPVAGPQTCSGNLSVDFAGNVTVPASASCVLSDARIAGSVSVASGASLRIEGRQFPTRIQGNVQAVSCRSANLFGAVKVAGTVQIIGCTEPSGFHGPAVVIGGSFQCVANRADCSADFGEVGGSVQMVGNISAQPSSTSQSVIRGSLQCDSNLPAPPSRATVRSV